MITTYELRVIEETQMTFCHSLYWSRLQKLYRHYKTRLKQMLIDHFKFDQNNVF